MKTKTLVKLIKGNTMNALQLKCLSVETGIIEGHLKMAQKCWEFYNCDNEPQHLQAMFLYLKLSSLADSCEGAEGRSIFEGYGAANRTEARLADAHFMLCTGDLLRARAICCEHIHAIINLCTPTCEIIRLRGRI